MQYYSHPFSILLLTILLSISCSAKKEITQNPPANQITDLAYTELITRHQAEYMANFIKDPRGPLDKVDLQHVHFFPADINFKCECTFEFTPDAKPFDIATYSGKTKAFKKHGTATCSINGQSTDVHIYANLRTIAMPLFRDHLFIPFKDHTNGESTYGGGRYIDLKTSDIQDNKVTIDFNKCYNPWCAYSDGYNCPIPPLENHFDIAIIAGEMMWTGEKKKAK